MRRPVSELNIRLLPVERHTWLGYEVIIWVGSDFWVSEVSMVVTISFFTIVGACGTSKQRVPGVPSRAVQLTLTSLGIYFHLHTGTVYWGTGHISVRYTTIRLTMCVMFHRKQLKIAGLFRNSLLFRLLLLLFIVTGFLSSLVLLLLSQWWTPPPRLQVSACSTFLMMCHVPSMAVFVENLLSVVLVLFPDIIVNFCL
jgi:hypothetical protein